MTVSQLAQEILSGKYGTILEDDVQKAIPLMAKDKELTQIIDDGIRTLPSSHSLRLGDSRQLLAEISHDSVDLVITSPPYWNIKAYPSRDGQLGLIADYEEFLVETDNIWRELYDLLKPGGRLVVIVGDVLVSRKTFGRHKLFPLHSSIQEHCRLMGFDNLAPIIWQKIGNASYEVENGSSGFLGKPYEPNAIIKNDIEYVIFLRKPGGYRTPTLEKRLLSLISYETHKILFSQIWNIPGATTRKHPAPFPLSLPERLIRMFSFVGDTVLDPFMGTGTTNLASALLARNSVGIEIDPHYFKMAVNRVRGANLKQMKLVSA